MTINGHHLTNGTNGHTAAAWISKLPFKGAHTADGNFLELGADGQWYSINCHDGHMIGSDRLTVEQAATVHKRLALVVSPTDQH